MLHVRLTEECRDTSDTDSYSTDEFATLDVLEYEIPSDSSTNEELYSHDSSSGTDVSVCNPPRRQAHVLIERNVQPPTTITHRTLW